MSDWLDVEHQRRLRAERVLQELQDLWGDQLPPGRHPELIVLIDAIAIDDEHARDTRLVSQGDGLTLDMLADLVRRAEGHDRDHRPGSGDAAAVEGAGGAGRDRLHLSSAPQEEELSTPPATSPVATPPAGAAVTRGTESMPAELLHQVHDLIRRQNPQLDPQQDSRLDVGGGSTGLSPNGRSSTGPDLERPTDRAQDESGRRDRGDDGRRRVIDLDRPTGDQPSWAPGAGRAWWRQPVSEASAGSASESSGQSGGHPLAAAEDPRVGPTPQVALGDEAERVGVWEIDPQSGAVAFDAVTARLVGAGVSAGHSTVEQHLEDLVHPDDRDRVEQAMRQALGTGTSYRVRFRVTSSAGAVTWLISHGRVLTKPSDRVPRLTGYITIDREAEHQTVPASAAP